MGWGDVDGLVCPFPAVLPSLQVASVVGCVWGGPEGSELLHNGEPRLVGAGRGLLWDQAGLILRPVRCGVLPQTDPGSVPPCRAPLCW